MMRELIGAGAVAALPLGALAQDLSCSSELGARYDRDDGAWALSDYDEPFAFALSGDATAPVLSAPDLGSKTYDCIGAGPAVTCAVGGLGMVVVNRDAMATAVFEWEGLIQGTSRLGVLTGVGTCEPTG